VTWGAGRGKHRRESVTDGREAAQVVSSEKATTVSLVAQWSCCAGARAVARACRLAEVYRKPVVAGVLDPVTVERRAVLELGARQL